MPRGDDDTLTSTLSSTRTSTISELSADFRPEAFLLLYHRDGSQLIPLLQGVSLVLGRARPADIPIRDRSLSRQHARFEFIEGELWVEDLGSTNGSRLNGKRIARSRVGPGDEVTLGSVTAVLHVLARAGSPLDLESHDTFVDKLEHEVVRCRTFSRKVAVLMVCEAKRKQAHLNRWVQRIRELLRPVDSTALYDQTSVLISLPESDEQAALTLARSLIAARQRGDPQLLVGVAIYPDHAGSTEELLEGVRQAMREATTKQPIRVAGEAPGRRAPVVSDGRPVVISAKMQEVFATARRLGAVELPVLILGETGTGKEVLARAIHEASPRRKKPLCCINCASIPEQLLESTLFGHERGAFTGADQRARGMFEEADGGTLLLDEVGELSPSAQAALLRVLETKLIRRVGGSKELAVDVRTLAATHRDLERMCQEGSFRWDLFYRLNAMMLFLPPLRERPEEIMPLAQSFIAEASRLSHCRVDRMDQAAAQLLMSYDWPGNVRELKNVIERGVVIAQDSTLFVDDLPERIRRRQHPPLSVIPTCERPASGEQLDDGSIKEKLRRYEAQLLLEALAEHDWNQTQTAKVLGMPLRTLVHKMKTLGLNRRYGPP